MGEMPSEKERAAVVAPVPSAEPVVSAWRERFDRSAARGMPAHITLVYPFLREQDLTDEVLATLLELCAERPVLDVAFRNTARFPGILHVEPEPADELRRFTVAIAEPWPAGPPYGGTVKEVISHLTPRRA